MKKSKTVSFPKIHLVIASNILVDPIYEDINAEPAEEDGVLEVEPAVVGIQAKEPKLLNKSNEKETI